MANSEPSKQRSSAVWSRSRSTTYYVVQQRTPGAVGMGDKAKTVGLALSGAPAHLESQAQPGLDLDRNDRLAELAQEVELGFPAQDCTEKVNRRQY